MSDQKLDWGVIRQKLSQQQGGKTFWRSLEELANGEEFLDLLQHEFPRQMMTGTFSTNRRTFLKLMGAALVMAGLTGCRFDEPDDPIVPYVTQPEEIVQGKPLFFASAMPFRGYGLGVLVENRMGRPTKVEGNIDHPASLGGTNPLMQGSIFDLYDPDRPQAVSQNGDIATWEGFLATLARKRTALSATGGAGLRVLTETVTSPTLGAQLAALREQFPQMRWHQYEPVGLDNVRTGTMLAFGRPVNVVYNFAEATRILALDANFLYSLPGSLSYARQFIENRRAWRSPAINAPAGESSPQVINRLYVVESTPTITGAKADHRLPLRASQIADFARAVAGALGLEVAPGATTWSEAQESWLAALVRDLAQHPGTSLVIAGEAQPPIVHALAYAINVQLGNVGHTLRLTEPVEVAPVNQLDSLRELVEAMAADQVDTLIILDSNPVYTAPADFDFASQLAKVNFTVHNSLHFDETSARCQWHIPQTHYLEAWSDVRAYEGTATILQPLLAPLFNSRTPHEVLAALLGEQPLRTAYEIVRETWEEYYNGLREPAQPTSDLFWRTALHDGMVAGTAAATVEIAFGDTLAEALRQPPATSSAGTATTEGLEINFRPDPSIWDGRFANNAWLQELPKHLLTLTWDNAALISPATAERLNLVSEAVVELRFQGRNLSPALLVVPGHPDDAVTLYLGYGRETMGAISEGLGFNAYKLRTSAAFHFGMGVEISASGETYPLATVQNHQVMEGREHVRAATLAHFREHPDFARSHSAPHPTASDEGREPSDGVVPHREITQPSLYPAHAYDGYAWGMAIDLSACIGCNACTIACMVENNIPTVGKEGVLNSREMHWLKVDRYYAGDTLENPEVYFQPRPCMHCENAPCEPVCPVGATLHDDEGLNQMVYNRCVGTRYCSNNCPYKVRRFNFFDYNEAQDEIPLMQMWRNPEVTVRSRGVMEKCTYCVQRIQHGRIEAERANRPIGDGEILTACQAACPTRAIVFGDINNPQSLVAQLKLQPLNYGLLEEIGTQPRTTYLAEVRNPNEEWRG